MVSVCRSRANNITSVAVIFGRYFRRIGPLNRHGIDIFIGDINNIVHNGMRVIQRNAGVGGHSYLAVPVAAPAGTDGMRQPFDFGRVILVFSGNIRKAGRNIYRVDAMTVFTISMIYQRPCNGAANLGRSVNTALLLRYLYIVKPFGRVIDTDRYLRTVV